MPSASDTYQILTTQQTGNLINFWQNQYAGNPGYWKTRKIDALKYTTAVIVDVIKLWFNSESYKNLFSEQNFRTVSISNQYSESVESLPQIVVSIGSYISYVRELGAGRITNDINQEMPESFDMTINLFCEGRNILECDSLVGQLSAGLLTMIIPGMATLTPMTIKASRSLSCTNPTSKQRSTNLKTISRSISIKAILDYVGHEFVIDEQRMTGIEEIDQTPV